MTKALTILKDQFMGLEIRIVMIDPDHPSIPLTDIAKATGYDPSNMTRLYKRNKKLLEDNAQNVKLVSGDQVAPINHICLEREGVIGILMKLDYVRIKDPERKTKIIEFQKWAKKKLAEMQIQSTIVKETGERWSDVAIEHMKFAGFLTQSPNVDPGLCMAIAIREAEKATGKDLTQYKKLIPPASTGYSEYLTVSAIAASIHMTAEEVNRYLVNNGYQFRDDSGTHYLTEKGSEYGRVFPLAARSGHVGYFIKWRREIIEASRMIQNRPCRIR